MSLSATENSWQESTKKDCLVLRILSKSQEVKSFQTSSESLGTQNINRLKKIWRISLEEDKEWAKGEMKSRKQRNIH